ncbi:hypothetical protein PVK06_012899 [Gossypium arboreum]|uniref:Uncharacterized protein n=1 Tax=Gossypium arboreum TaxID=29729 RepID=A0ABR0QCY7_GOSAR|nr:hypothetical protein PVK06_012899 [Gossypium arboreum]
MEICNKMWFQGEKMKDVTIVEKILHSMMSKFDYVVWSIEESKDINVLSLDELQSSLLVHKGRGKGRGIGRGRGDQHDKDDGNRNENNNFRTNDDQSKGNGRDFDKTKIKFFKCQKFNHYRFECYVRLPNDKDEQSHFVENKERFETLLMAIEVEKEPNLDVWYVDTSRNNHMFGISFGDYSTVDVMGKGNINIRTKNGFVETISKVL